MAVILVDGFDLYNGTGANTGLQAKWSLISGGTDTGSAMGTGRFSGQDLEITGALNSDRLFGRSFTATASLAVGFAFRMSALPASNQFILFFNTTSGAAWQDSLLLTTTGTLTACRNTAISTKTDLGTTASQVIFANTWHYLEVELTISDTVGVYKVYVDGVQQLNLTAQDTRNGSPTTVDTIYIGNRGGNPNPANVLSFDDLYVVDAATKLGERRVETLYPTSDVAQGWARSTGATNYTLVDEAQANGDTDYVQGTNVGDVDTYGFGDLSSTPTNIDAVQMSIFAEKTDATSRSIAAQLKSGATTSDGGNFALASSYGKFERLTTQDPNTSAAWTASGVNALQGGPKVTV